MAAQERAQEESAEEDGAETIFNVFALQPELALGPFFFGLLDAASQNENERDFVPKHFATKVAAMD